MNEPIADPLVRLTFEAKRKVEELQQGVELAERDLVVAQTGLELARDAQDVAREGMLALMDALTSDQQSDLILYELAHHQNSTQAAQKALGHAQVMFGGTTYRSLTVRNGAYVGMDYAAPQVNRASLNLLPDDHAANGLSVVWTKP